MSYLKSKYNVCVFTLPEDFKITESEAFALLSKKKFKDVQPSEDFSHGWVTISDLFKELSAGETYAGDYIMGGYRFDKKRVPPVLVKKLYLERLLERKNEGITLDKKAKKLLKEECTKQLLMKTLAMPKSVTWILDPHENKVYVDSKSKGVIGTFGELFFETFKAPIVQEDYSLDEDNQKNFLDFLWATSEDTNSYWVDHEVTLDSEKNTFKFNGPDINDYLDDIGDFKKFKKIKTLNIGMKVGGTDYSVTLNNSNMILDVEIGTKIEHEEAETAILDNLDHMKTLQKEVTILVDQFLDNADIPTSVESLEG